MTNDVTQRLNGSLEDKVDKLILAVQGIGSRIDSIESRIESIESRIGSIELRIDSIESRIESIEVRIDSIEVRIDSIDLRLGNVESRLGSLENKVEERLKDARPMWEAVQAQLTEMEANLRGEIEGLRKEMEKGFRLVDRQMEGYTGELGRIRGHQRDVEERVDKIEKQLNR